MEPSTKPHSTSSVQAPKFADLINGDKPVLIDFTAAWCGPCEMMPPILAELKRKIGDKLTIIKVDIDKNPHAAKAYNVMSVPTLLLVRRGEVKWRQSGVMPASQIQKAVGPFIG